MLSVCDSRRWLLILLAPLLAVLAWLVVWQRDPITNIAFSPEGTLLATSTDSGDDSGLEAWNVANGGKVFSVTTHSAITSMQFSPGGATLATAHRDGRVRLWNAAGGELRTTIAAAPSAIVALAFTPDGEQLICVGATGVVTRCNAATGKAITLGTVALPGVVALSSDAKRVAACEAPRPSAEGRTTVYDLSSEGAKPVAHLPGSLLSIAFSPDGQLLAGVPSGLPGKRSLPTVWDIDLQQSQGSIANQYVKHITFANDRWTVATADLGDTVRLWDWASGKHRWGSLGVGGGEISALGASANGTIATATRDDGQVHLWTAASGQYRALRAVPPDFWIAGLLAAWVVLFAAWAVAWVRSGLRSKHPSTPLIDATLLLGILIAALAARVAMTGRPYQVGPPAVACGIGMLAGILGLAVIWALTGSARWQSRLPVLLLAWAFAWALPLAVGRMRGFEDSQIWELTIAEVAMFASLAVALRIGQAGRRRRTTSAGAAAPRQFLLKDLVIWTAAAGVLLAVARHLSPRVQPPIVTAFEAVGGVALGVSCATGYWAVGGRSRIAMAFRLLVLIAVAVAAGSATEPFRRLMALHPWWWYVTIDLSAALCVAGPLLIARLHRDNLLHEERG